jgi:hypothetical protein
MASLSKRWRDPDWWTTVGVMGLFAVAAYVLLTVAFETRSFLVLGVGALVLAAAWQKVGRHWASLGPHPPGGGAAEGGELPTAARTAITPAERPHLVAHTMRVFALWAAAGWVVAFVVLALVGQVVENGDMPALLWVPATAAVIVLLLSPLVWLAALITSVRSWSVRHGRAPAAATERVAGLDGVEGSRPIAGRVVGRGVGQGTGSRRGEGRVRAGHRG